MGDIEQHGNAQTTLVLVHGFPLDRSLWSEQLSLSRHLRLVLFDLPGFGGTPVGPTTGDISSHGDAVLAAMDRGGVARATLCGLSMGGYILFDLWRRAPGRIERLILCDTRAEADSPQGRAGRERSIALVREGRRAEATAGIPEQLLAASSAPRLRARVEAMIERTSDQGLVTALQAMRDRPDSTADLASITVPTLIVVGVEDTLTPPAVARTMRDAIPGASLVEIPHAGHLSPLENPPTFNQAVKDFLIQV